MVSDNAESRYNHYLVDVMLRHSQNQFTSKSQIKLKKKSILNSLYNLFLVICGFNPDDDNQPIPTEPEEEYWIISKQKHNQVRI